MKKAISLVLLLTIIISLFTGCSSSPETTTVATTKAATTAAGTTANTTKIDESKLPQLKLGVFDSRISFNVWYIMKNKMDVANGFKIIETRVSGGNAINEALGAGLLDAAQIGTPAAVNSAAVYGAKIIAETSEGGGGLNLIVRKDSDIAKATGNSKTSSKVLGSAATLKGKTLIYPVGTMAQMGVARYLEEFGLTLEDVKSVNMNYGPAYQAFKAGQGDVVAVFSPGQYTAIADGFVNIGNLFYLKYPVKDVLIADKKAYADPAKKEMIKKLLILIYQVNDMMAADAKKENEFLGQFHKEMGAEVSVQNLPNEIETMYLITSTEAKKSIANLGSSVVSTAQYYVKIGILEAVKVDAIKACIDPSLFNETIK